MAEMVLQPPGRAPERLLLYGPQDTGKTTAIAKILARALGPGQTAYILDTDNSWARVLESGNHPRLVVRAADRDASRVWDGWVTVGFVGDDATGEYQMYRLHPSNPAWRPVDGPRALN